MSYDCYDNRYKVELFLLCKEKHTNILTYKHITACIFNNNNINNLNRQLTNKRELIFSFNVLICSS